MTPLSTFIYVAACGVLGYTGFCRLVHIDQGTRPTVRVAMVSLTVAAVAGLFAVGFWNYRPQWPGAAMACAMAVVQVVTSRAWRGGVPAAYRRHA